MDLLKMLMNRPYIEDVTPYNDDNLCLLMCVVKHFKPEESVADREKRVKLMWRVFRASKHRKVKSDSVILDHRQVLLEDDIDYLYNDVLDYKYLMRELPPDHKWGVVEVQQSPRDMKGVSLEELSEMETIFNIYIDVLAIKELQEKKNKNTYATVILTSDRPVDRSVNLLLYMDNYDMAHYLLVTDTKKLLKN